jgi:hypothetical protein
MTAVARGWLGQRLDILREMAVSERLRLIPLRDCLFTPELQWQPRGKGQILRGCELETPLAERSEEGARSCDRPAHNPGIPPCQTRRCTQGVP